MNTDLDIPASEHTTNKYLKQNPRPPKEIWINGKITPLGTKSNLFIDCENWKKTNSNETSHMELWRTKKYKDFFQIDQKTLNFDPHPILEVMQMKKESTNIPDNINIQSGQIIALIKIPTLNNRHKTQASVHLNINYYKFNYGYLTQGPTLKKAHKKRLSTETFFNEKQEFGMITPLNCFDINIRKITTNGLHLKILDIYKYQSDNVNEEKHTWEPKEQKVEPFECQSKTTTSHSRHDIFRNCINTIKELDLGPYFYTQHMKDNPKDITLLISKED